MAITNELAKLGSISEKLAEGLTNQSYRFVIILIFALASAAGWLFSSSILLAISILAIGVMGMLFGLLAPENRPKGWNAVWTFILMLCYFAFAVILLVFVYWSTSTPTPSQMEEQAWQELYGKQFFDLNEGLRTHLFEAGYTNEQGWAAKPTNTAELYKSIDTYVSSSDRRSALLQVANALEGYRRCAPLGCDDPVISGKFDDRIKEFWPNFRCSLLKIATSGGYNDTMVDETKARFETLYANSGPKKDSGAVCHAAFPLTGSTAECPPLPISPEQLTDLLRDERNFPASVALS
jgi:hypothetical protein